MNNLKFKHRNAYTINTADNSAKFDLYNMDGNVIDTFLIDLEDVDYIANPKKNDKQLISRIKFLSRTHREKTKPLTVYAAYLIEKTVYGRSIPKDEYESKMLEILKLTSDERFMVEKRILPKLKRLLDAINEMSDKQE